MAKTTIKVPLNDWDLKALIVVLEISISDMEGKQDQAYWKGLVERLRAKLRQLEMAEF